VVVTIAVATDAPPFERTSHNTIVWHANINNLRSIPKIRPAQRQLSRFQEGVCPLGRVTE